MQLNCEKSYINEVASQHNKATEDTTVYYKNRCKTTPTIRTLWSKVLWTNWKHLRSWLLLLF